MRKKVAALIFSVIFALQYSTISAVEPVPETDTYWPSKVRLGTSYSNEDRGIFYIDYLVPIYYSDDQNTLLFFNPKETYFTPHASDEINIGTGLRHIFNDDFILGLNIFYDKKYSDNDKWYNQVGVGLEYLSQALDIRFNYYDPLTDPKKLGVVSGSYELGSAGLLSVNNYEEPLEGFDGELGFPVLPEKFGTRLYVGGFFYNSELAKDLSGFRARTETNINKWLALDATFNLKSHGESEFIGGLRVTIPLELGRVLSGKNPLKTASQPSYIKDRLFERVIRDVDIQTRDNGTKRETVTDSVGPVEMIYVDNTADAGLADGTLEHPYVAIADAFSSTNYIGNGGNARYIYVFQGTGSPSLEYTGSFVLDSPNVTLWGSGSDLGFTGVPVLGYPVIEGGAPVSVITIDSADGCRIAGLQVQNALTGIQVNNSSGFSIKDNIVTTIGGPTSGIDIFNDGIRGPITGFTISGNIITNNSGTGLFILNNGDMSDFSITGNTVAGNQTYYGGIALINNGDMSDFDIAGNTVTDNLSYMGGGITLFNDGDMSDFSISGNTVIGNSVYSNDGDAAGGGIVLFNDYGNMFDFDITGNTVIGNSVYSNNGDATGGGIVLANYYGNMSDFSISGNTVIGNSAQSDYYSSYPYYNSGNSYGGGIALLNEGDSYIDNFSINGNTVDGNSISAYGNSYGGGIALLNEGEEIFDFSIAGNTVTSNTVEGGYDASGGGIALLNDGYLIDGFDISDNTVTGNSVNGQGSDTSYGGGIALLNDGFVIDDFSITGNTVTGNSTAYNGYGGGIALLNRGGYAMGEFDITGNTVNGNSTGFGGGIAVLDMGGSYGIGDFSFTGNTVIANSAYYVGGGISLFGYMGPFTYSGNTVSGNSPEDYAYGGGPP